MKSSDTENHWYFSFNLEKYGQKIGLDKRKGDKRGQWVGRLNEETNAHLKVQLLECLKTTSTEEVAECLEDIYQKLSRQIPEPPIKKGEGRYRITVPADMASDELCILEKIAAEGLKWNVDFFVVETAEID